jgi:hypothetical protein
MDWSENDFAVHDFADGGGGLDGKNPAKFRHADARGFREKAKTFQTPWN